ncbi:class I SAM-dependent methyltransferase [Muriicola sp. Z0-33]|uniref:class I SAM-dependent methyltransferase n=1 Tax=Muriicola sp. Z0-33 TaxID=2816957 RepID=UPI0022372F53|nr:class I SAM-dependent methyltransferase [Muriicola sp. Z0-33]MCW5515406.1 class I SAM-dependent methyltransferase [Muriicola sp. Z0-33]
MRKTNIFLLLFSMLFLSMVNGQSTTSIEQRNEQIRQRWNRSLVRDSAYTFNKEVNNLLKQTTAALPKGKALCVAMGQGRNAMYLARNGWDVTGFDLADEAVAYAVEQAKKEQIPLKTEITSFETFDYGENKWDLITWLYGGCLWTEGITSTIKTALKPGGLFVFEFFHRDAGMKMNRPTFGCEENDIKQKFLDEGGFEILLYEEKEGVADYSLKPYKLVYMVVSKK